MARRQSMMARRVDIARWHRRWAPSTDVEASEDLSEDVVQLKRPRDTVTTLIPWPAQVPYRGFPYFSVADDNDPRLSAHHEPAPLSTTSLGRQWRTSLRTLGTPPSPVPPFT